MNGSFSFVLHLIVFGMVAGTLLSNFILDRKLRAEKDWGRRLYIGGLMRTFGALAPYNVILLILTGLANMYNRYLGAPYPWYEEQWLVIKLVCFVVLVFNAMFIVPKIGMKCGMLIKSVVDKSAPANSDAQFAAYNRKVSIIFMVQTTLLLAIVILLSLGTGKHPGQF